MWVLFVLAFAGLGPSYKRKEYQFLYPLFSAFCTDPLVPVVLGYVDREGDVIEDDITPGDVPRKTISTGPALESSAIELVLHHNVLEQDVLDRCDGTTLAERTNREAMATFTVGLNRIGQTQHKC